MRIEVIHESASLGDEVEDEHALDGSGIVVEENEVVADVDGKVVVAPVREA